MGDKTGIEWTRGADGSPGATWTPIRARNKITGKVGWHCEHVSPGCLKCYSEALNRDRFGTRLPFKPGHRGDIELLLDEEMLLQPLRWQRPRMIFVCSMTDLFADFVPDPWIDRVMATIFRFGTDWHTAQVLTKRSARMRRYMADPATPRRIFGLIVDGIAPDAPSCPVAPWPGDREQHIDALIRTSWPLPALWLGVSTEDQRRADERVPDLLATPATARFVSAEPLLGPIDFGRICLVSEVTGSLRAGIHLDALNGRYCESGMPYIGEWDVTRPYPTNEHQRRLDQIIVGGESGTGARPLWTPDVRSIARQCQAAGVAVFVKQLGANVRDRNDAGFDGCELDGWPDMEPDDIEEDLDRTRDGYQGAPVRIRLRDRKGGDPSEWPADLRVREMPLIARAGRLLDGVEHNGMPTTAKTGGAP